jgi:hypothetical protein
VGYAITLDFYGQPCVVGNSTATWGTPVHAFSAGVDAFVARVSADTGVMSWNTFVGGTGTEEGKAIAISNDGNILIAGDTSAGWDDQPLDGVGGGGGGVDAYVTEIATLTGVMGWTTYIGGSGNDYGLSLVGADDGMIYLAGSTTVGWMETGNRFAEGGGGGSSAFLTQFDANGAEKWTTFLGDLGGDYGIGVGIDAANYAYVAGYSEAPWGSGPEGYQSGWDGFVARVDTRLMMYLPLVIK